MVAVIVLAGGSVVWAHPGKTDKWGGHKCWKECGSWELEVGEYHLHDKDFNPLRVRSRSVAKENPPAPASGEPEYAEDRKESLEKPADSAEPRKKPGTIVVKRYDYIRVYDEEIIPTNSLLLALAAVFLLLLLLVIRIRRRRG